MRFNNSIIKTSLLVGLLTTVLSCQKLTERPEGIPSPANFYTTLDQCHAALAGSLNALWGYYEESYSVEVNGEMFWLYDDQYDGGDLIIPVTHANSLWKSHYKALLNINGMLAAIKNGSLDKSASAADIDEIVAEGKFLRAFNYFYLVRMYGDIPLITEDTPDPVNNPVKTRTPVEEVYNLIISDFNFAIDKLPGINDLGSTPGRPSKGAAKGLLAKVYLTMAGAPLNKTENYALAANLAKEVIDGGEYSLIPNVQDVFLQSNKYASEMMFSLHSTTDDYATDPNGGVPNELNGYGGELVSVNFDTTFPNQPRKDAYLLEYIVIDGDTLHWPDFDVQTPYIRKLYNPPYVTQDEISSFLSYANMNVLRYADVLMIYAEAANRVNGGPTQAAADALNLVIDRANGHVANSQDPLATTALSMQDFEDKVLRERSWELCFEMGDRWFDICRKRILDKVSDPDFLPNYTTDDYLFPIPSFDADAIGSQNPGY